MKAQTEPPFALSASELSSVQSLERLLKDGKPAIVSEAGVRLDVPPTIYHLLRRVVELMAKGRSVSVLPDNSSLTTQRAADFLGMSRPFLIKLLETGAMAFHKVGNQRRIYLRDVIEFAQRRDEEREAALDRLSRQAYDLGLYDRNQKPETGSGV